MSTFLQALFVGLALAGAYALVAIGFSVFFQATQVLPLTQGAVMAVAGMSAATFVAHFGHGWYAIPVCIVVAIVFQVLTYLAFIASAKSQRQKTQRSHALSSDMVAITLGASIAATGLIQLGWGSQTRGFPALSNHQFTVAGAKITGQEALALLVAIVVVVGLALLYLRTFLGRAIRAVAIEPEGSAGVGINRRRLLAFSLVLSGGLSGLAVALLVPVLGVSSQSGNDFVLIALTATVIGGLRNVWGAIIGGLVLGLISGFTSAYEPAWFDVIQYVLLLAVLLGRASFTGREGGRRSAFRSRREAAERKSVAGESVVTVAR